MTSRSEEQRPSKPSNQGLATPAFPGEYTSTCLLCQRQMLWADKRCRVCTDCNKPQEQPSSNTKVEAYSMYVDGQQVAAEATEHGTWVRQDDYERVVAELIAQIAALGGYGARASKNMVCNRCKHEHDTCESSKDEILHYCLPLMWADIDILRMTQRLNVETVARLQQERDQLQRHDEIHWKTRRSLLNRIAELEQAPEPPKVCVHPWCWIVFSEDGNPSCTACRINLLGPSLPPNALRIGDCIVNERGRKGVVHSVSIVEVRWQDGGKGPIPCRGLQLRAYEDADGAIAPPVTKTAARKVGCESSDGLLRIHGESEVCDVCGPGHDANGSPVADCPHCDGFEVDGIVRHGPRCTAVETTPPQITVPCHHGIDPAICCWCQHTVSEGESR